MRVRNVDDNNDWTFGQSDLNYTKNETAILLDVKMRLKEWFMDCFFALQHGIPWSVRLGAHNQKKSLDEDVKNTILGTNGVLNLTEFKSIVLDRRYRATCKIYTIFSTEFQDFMYETEI